MNRGEPPTQTVSERLAFAMKKTAGDRRDTVKLVKDVYNTRSLFVHHGEGFTDEQMKNVREVIQLGWTFVMSLLPTHERWDTKEEFLTAVDDEKFKGPGGL